MAPGSSPTLPPLQALGDAQEALPMKECGCLCLIIDTNVRVF